MHNFVENIDAIFLVIIVLTSPCEFATFKALKLARALDFDDKCAPHPSPKIETLLLSWMELGSCRNKICFQFYKLVQNGTTSLGRYPPLRRKVKLIPSALFISKHNKKILYLGLLHVLEVCFFVS